MAYEAGEPNLARQLQGRLEGTVRDPDQLNTQEKGQLLRAAHFMLQAAGPINVQGSGAVVSMPSAGLTPRWAVNGPLAATRFFNAGNRPLWRTVTVRGTPLTPPDAQANGLTVAKTYYSFAGGQVDLANVHQGDRIIVRLSGSSQQGRTVSMAVDDALPAGFEIETVLGPDDSGEHGAFHFLGTLTDPKIQESRDDRYVAALDVGGNQSWAVAYVARAVTPGDFYLPGVVSIDMYHAGIEARSGGGRTVIAPGG